MTTRRDAFGRDAGLQARMTFTLLLLGLVYEKEVIKAQYSAAEAQAQISPAATAVGEQIAGVGLAVQRALEKTEDMKARADTVGGLEAAGTFEDLTQLGPPQDDVKRQREPLGRSKAVDEDLAALRAQLGPGSEQAPQLRRPSPCRRG